MIDPTIPGPRLPEAPAVGARPTTAQLLAGRVLYQENARFLPRLRDCVDAKLSGVVMTGKKADERAFQLRDAGYRGVLLIDSAAYMTHTATPDEPFLLPQDSLFDDMDNCLAFQRRRGATAALTPTGYIPAAASKTLKAVMRAAGQIERDDVVVVLPVDIAWLNSEHITQFIAACRRIRQPKAVILTRQFDPLEAFTEAPANLRRLVSEVEHIALLRTDLAALDAMAYGALFAGIGANSSIRHAVPARERPQTAKTGGGPQYPSVLLPDLMRFSGTQALANRYANADPPKCDCEMCQGRGLDRFNSPGELARTESEAHNAYTWGAWVNKLAACESATERRQWWRDRCVQALGCYELENLRIEQPHAFKPPKPLTAWATLPIGDDTPASTEGGSQGISSAAG